MTRIISLLFLLLLSTDVFAAATGTGTIADLKWGAFNFVLLFGFLGFKLKKPLKDMFDKNAEEVTSLYSYAEKKDKEAQIRLDECKKKVANLENEKKKIIKDAEVSAEDFSKQHTSDTDDLIKAFRVDADARIEGEKAQMAKNLNASLLDEVINKVKASVNSNSDLKDKATKKLLSQI